MDALKPIAANALKAVEARKKDRNYVREVERKLQSSGNPLKLVKLESGNSIIAEVKFASPSEGVISDCRLEGAVNDYVKGGAAALSILTEEKYFKGNLNFIEQARKLARIPILRKDFILDEFQIKEAKAFGADGVLLIASLLENKLGEFIDLADFFGLWALVEVHNEQEIQSALDSGAKIIGINNRNLSTLKVDLGTTIQLSSLIPKTKILVTESGINTPEDIQKLKQECKRKPDFYLIGTSLMKSASKKEKLKQLVNA